MDKVEQQLQVPKEPYSEIILLLNLKPHTQVA